MVKMSHDHSDVVWQPFWISWQLNEAHNLVMLACNMSKLVW